MFAPLTLRIQMRKKQLLTGGEQLITSPEAMVGVMLNRLDLQELMVDRLPLRAPRFVCCCSSSISAWGNASSVNSEINQ